MKITANKFVAVTYDLNVGEGEERELMERATAETPLKFIFGTGAMLPAFEDALKGLEVCDKFNFSITPADAYGEYVEEHVLDLPKNIFEVDGKFDSGNDQRRQHGTDDGFERQPHERFCLGSKRRCCRYGLQPSVGWRNIAFQW